MALSKTHQDYWIKRLKKRSYCLADGKNQVVEEWQVYIQYLRRRQWFPLGSNNKIAASKRASEIYQSLRVQGWEETLKRYKGVMEDKKTNCTIGEFLKAVEKTGHLSPKTFANYYRWLRTIVSQLKGIPDSVSKYDYRGGGYDAWRTQVDSVPLFYLTPDRVRKWQKQFLERAGSDPLKMRKAEFSVNSAIRNARSLFSSKLLAKLSSVEIPSPHPFEGVALVKCGNMRYRSQIDTAKLAKAAQDELVATQPELFKIFLLSLFAGLRRNEMDKLLWASIDWKECCVKIEPTRYFSPKTESSIGSVFVDEKVMTLLKEYKKQTTGSFVIESRVKPRGDTRYAHYRAEKHFRKLTDWLRGKGINTTCPLHTLRKEYGRLVTENYGIYAASKALRHAGIQITAAHYADDKRRILVKMDELAGVAPQDVEK